MKIKLDQEDLKNIASGACFLGSGGGGAYATGMQIAEHFTLEAVNVYDIDDIQKENKSTNQTNYGVVTAVMGSPEKMKGIKNGKSNAESIKKLIEIKGIKLDQIKCIVPVEIGALSSVIACVTAAELGIPVINADGAGRAVPKLNMTTFSIEHKFADINPCILLAKNSDHVALDITDGPTAASTVESLARPTLSLPKFDGMATIALWLIDLNNLEIVLPIQGTLTKCLELGRSIQHSLKGTEPINLDEIIKTLCKINYEPKTILSNCTLLSATTTSTGGFDNGIIMVRNEDDNELLKIIFINESLLLWSDKKSAPRVIAPDLISYIIIPEGTNEQYIYSNGDIMEDGKLRKDLFGAKIIVICMEAPPELKEHDENLRFKQNNASEKEMTLHDSYNNMLKELNYFGDGKSSF